MSEQIYYKKEYQSPIGPLMLVSDQSGQSLIGLWMKDQKHFAGKLKTECLIEGDNQVLSHTEKWLEAYFSDKQPAISDLNLKPQGTEFQNLVWSILADIPYGQVITYSQIGKEVARRRGLASMSGQAVGGAVGRNPISVIIPCHRVIGQDGSLTGYAGGLDKKVWLLTHEGYLKEN